MEVMNVRISILPKTSLGRWSVWLVVACVLLFVLIVALGAFTGVDVTILGSVGILLGAGSFVTGLIGIIKNKERSILVFLAIIIEVLALIIILGELLIPQ
jgi:hypothetical protein